jgi:hypothetical protein
MMGGICRQVVSQRSAKVILLRVVLGMMRAIIGGLALGDGRWGHALARFRKVPRRYKKIRKDP